MYNFGYDILHIFALLLQTPFHQEGGAEVSCAAYHGPTHLLVVGFTSGLFTFHEMPDFNLIHSLRYVIKEPLFMNYKTS